ncbi:MAG: DUF6111 family protein [Pseudomonadota bacterium]
MVRIVLENIILLLLPTLLYFTYIFVMRGKSASRQQTIDDAPFIWLFAGGVLLMLGVMVAFGNMTAHKPSEIYSPPVFRDGKIVPGGYSPGDPRRNGAVEGQ